MSFDYAIVFHSIILGVLGWALKELYQMHACLKRLDAQKKDKK